MIQAQNWVSAMPCAESTTRGRGVIITINFVSDNEDLNERATVNTWYLRRQGDPLNLFGEVPLDACVHILVRGPVK